MQTKNNDIPVYASGAWPNAIVDSSLCGFQTKTTQRCYVVRHAHSLDIDMSRRAVADTTLTSYTNPDVGMFQNIYYLMARLRNMFYIHGLAIDQHLHNLLERLTLYALALQIAIGSWILNMQSFEFKFDLTVLVYAILVPQLMIYSHRQWRKHKRVVAIETQLREPVEKPEDEIPAIRRKLFASGTLDWLLLFRRNISFLSDQDTAPLAPYADRRWLQKIGETAVLTRLNLYGIFTCRARWGGKFGPYWQEKGYKDAEGFYHGHCWTKSEHRAFLDFVIPWNEYLAWMNPAEQRELATARRRLMEELLASRDFYTTKTYIRIGSGKVVQKHVESNATLASKPAFDKIGESNSKWRLQLYGLRPDTRQSRGRSLHPEYFLKKDSVPQVYRDSEFLLVRLEGKGYEALRLDEILEDYVRRAGLKRAWGPTGRPMISKIAQVQYIEIEESEVETEEELDEREAEAEEEVYESIKSRSRQASYSR